MQPGCKCIFLFTVGELRQTPAPGRRNVDPTDERESAGDVVLVAIGTAPALWVHVIKFEIRNLEPQPAVAASVVVASEDPEAIAARRHRLSLTD